MFCDVDPETFCVTPETVERALTPATRAVIAVDLFGRMAPVDRLREQLAGRGIAVARGRGAGRGRAPAGTRARVARRRRRRSASSRPRTCSAWATAARSRPTTTAVAEQARLLRFHGSRDKSTFEAVGWNSRLDAIQAAVLRVTLTRLDGWNERRRELAAAYAEAGLGDVVALPAARGRARSRSTTCS